MTERAFSSEFKRDLEAVEFYCDTVATSWNKTEIEIVDDLLVGVLYESDTSGLKSNQVEHIVTWLTKYYDDKLESAINPGYLSNSETILPKLTARRIMALRDVWQAAVFSGIQPIESLWPILTIIQANFKKIGVDETPMRDYLANEVINAQKSSGAIPVDPMRIEAALALLGSRPERRRRTIGEWILHR